MAAAHDQSCTLLTINDRGDALQELGVSWLLEVLQVAEVGDKVWLVQNLLLGEIIEIGRIGKALHELGLGQ